MPHFAAIANIAYLEIEGTQTFHVTYLCEKKTEKVYLSGQQHVAALVNAFEQGEGFLPLIVART